MNRLRTCKLALVLVVVLTHSLDAVRNRVDAAGDRIELTPHWKKGQKLRYEMRKKARRSRGDKVTFNTTARTDFEIEVLSASRESIVLAWTFGETKFDDPKLTANPLWNKMQHLLQGHRIILELDARGDIRGVQNWKELKDKSVKLIEAIIGELKTADAKQELLDKIRSQAVSMYATKEQVEQLTIGDAALLLMAFGKEFKGDRPIEFEDTLPNMMGGAPFPARSRFALKEVEKRQGLASVAWSQHVDTEKARRIMEQSIREMARQLGKPAPDGDLFKKLTIESNAEFRIDLSSGAVQSLTYRRAVTIDDTVQDVVISITRKKD